MIIQAIKRFLRNIINDVTASESINQSKNKWNDLSEKNARYFIMSDYGENIDKKKFEESGEKDFNELIMQDQFLKDRAGPFKEKTLLEIGCGIGRITEFLANEFKEVIGLDISDKMIASVKERLKDKVNVRFFATDGITYPLSSESVDIVFSFIVFQHMPDRETVKKNFVEAARVLKKGGIMKVQLRGLPCEKNTWYYGPSYTMNQLRHAIRDLPFLVVKDKGENQKYFWVWLEKK